MINRCTRPSDESYRFYGAKGITVYDPWLKDFQTFLADMGEPPSEVHTIERKDSKGNYTPENCVWATMKEQQNNRSNNVHLTYNGETLTLSQWADRIGINRKTLQFRLRRGWSIERALTEGIHLEKRRIL